MVDISQIYPLKRLEVCFQRGPFSGVANEGGSGETAHPDDIGTFSPMFNTLVHLYDNIRIGFVYYKVFVGWLVGWLVGWFMVVNSNFNNISVISWRSVLLVGKTGVFGENHRPVAGH